MSATEADILAQSQQILDQAAADRNRSSAIANAFAAYQAQVADLTDKLKEALDGAGIKPAKDEAVQAAYDNLKLAIDNLDASAVADAAILNTEPPAPPPGGPAPSTGGGPLISSIEPSFAVPAGGSSVTILGNGFAGVQSVTFGGVQSPSVAPDHDGSLVAVVPPGTGTVDVVVTAASGASAPVPFTYAEHSAPIDDAGAQA